MHPGVTRALVFAALALTACSEPDGPCGGSGDDDGTDDTVVPCDIGGRNTFYAVDRILLPTTPELADRFALNLDGDEQNRVDNALERILTYLTDVLPDLEPQPSTDEAIDTGDVVYLNRIKANALTTATGVDLWWYLGDQEDDGRFTVDAWSPGGAKVVGQIVGGRFTGGPGRLTIGITLGPGETWMLDLIGARVTAVVSEEGIGTDETPALLGGAITKEDFLERFGGHFQFMMSTDCDADCNCVVGSKGEAVRDLFDEDPDCTLSPAELEQSEFMTEIAPPDVDLLDAEGNFDPRSDGLRDSISIGFAFTSVGATFTPPADPDVDQ